MSELVRILIADTDEAFRQATADVLRSQGYECHFASDGQAAAEMLERDAYSVLIVDVDIPGNERLGLVRALCLTAPGVRVILTARYPDAEAAAAAVELPVTAYLVKPVDSEVLLQKVGAAFRQACFYRAVRGLGKRVRSWRHHLAEIEESLLPDSEAASGVSIDLFLDLTFSAIAESLVGLRELTAALAGVATEREACRLVKCPRVAAFREALLETVQVLKETKGAFKSKRLGELRRSLEKCLNEDPTQLPRADAESGPPTPPLGSPRLDATVKISAAPPPSPTHPSLP